MQLQSFQGFKLFQTRRRRSDRQVTVDRCRRQIAIITRYIANRNNVSVSGKNQDTGMSRNVGINGRMLGSTKNATSIYSITKV